MTAIKRWVAPAIAVALVLSSALVRAQVLQQVPSDALVVLKVNNIKAFSDKVGKLSQDLGIVAMAPEMADPLGALQTKAKMKQGIDTAGDLAIVMLDPATHGGNPEDSLLILLPVSDYKSFLSNWPDAKTQGDISEIKVPDDPSPEFVASRGKYAVISSNKDLVATKPASFLSAPSATARELLTKDAILFANFVALRPKLLPNVQQGRAMVVAQMQGALARVPQSAKYMPILRTTVTQLFDVAEGFLNEAEAATVGLSLVPDGMNTSWVTEFKSGGYVTTNIASQKNTDATLLNGLPDGKYLLYGGGISDPQKTLKVFNDFADPIVKQVLAMGPEMAPVEELVGAIKAQIAARTGQTFGLLAPSGALGAEAIMQIVAIQRGDAKAMMATLAPGMDAEQKLFKAMNLANIQGMTPTYTPNAKTIDGVSFSAVGVKMAANPQNRQAMQQQQAMAIMYGPNGLNYYSGVVGDKLLTVAGVSDQVIGNAIAAIKSNAAPLEASDGFKEVSAQLPKQRLGVVYVDVAQIATTTLSYLKQFGFAMPVQLPPGLPPVGATISTDQGTALRLDVYVPKSLVQSLVAAGMQAQMQMQGGGGPGGPRGGGL